MLMWLRSRSWPERLFIAACVVAVAVQWVVITQRRAKAGGDFDISREFGRRFLAREYLYRGGLHYPYMPSAAMQFAPLALVNPSLGIVLRYGVAVGGLWLTFRLLWIMVGSRGGVAVSNRFPIGAITLVLASHYIIRDLDDGGPHLILLAFLVGGMYAVWKGRPAQGAIWFGLATGLKAPAGLMLPLFLWKRQWRLAAFTAAAMVFWIVLPMVWMGPASWWRHQGEWTRVALGSVLGHRTAGVEMSEERVQNQAFRPALMRYLVTYPEGHSRRLPHPGYVSVLDLEPGMASRLVTAVMLGGLAVCAWHLRRPYPGPADAAWVLECSAILVLSLLLSPVTWTQHLVMMLPTLYLIVTEDRAIRRLGQPAAAAMWTYVVLAVVLNRELLGKDTYILLLSYHIHTLAMLLVLAVLLLRRPTAGFDLDTPRRRC